MFELRLEDNLFQLHEELVHGTYTHGSYSDFYVCDPKRRHIHKASVRDRVLHQAIFRVLYPIFDKHFIFHTYSSRKSKGTHLGLKNFYKSCRKVGKNWKIKTYVLKCDIRKFFDSIDHDVLRSLITKRVYCPKTIKLINSILGSFEKSKGKGLPLGNVTSQLFANIYLDEFDQFVKHGLKALYYLRYCDDFVIIHRDNNFLIGLVPKIMDFLDGQLKLALHPKKLQIRSAHQGIDFLGYITMPHMIIPRTSTKKRIMGKTRDIYRKLKGGKVSAKAFRDILISYLGILSHCRNRKTEGYIKRFL